jgi:hypothetical protein
MDEHALNISVGQSLKTFGVSPEREIEKAVRNADSKGKLTKPGLPRRRYSHRSEMRDQARRALA